jgi:4-amino-4-deoxy-L-arabinose transferase-like glycosyltransferase
VGGSRDNTVRNLLFDYNGLGRVDGQAQGGGGRPPGGARFAPPGGAGGGGAVAGPGGIFGGQPGTLRLFSDAVGGQIAWLLPLAAVGAAFALWWHRRDPARLGAMVLWAGWLVLCAVVFSYAKGIFHSYYTSEMAPPLAAAIGVGGVALARAARRVPAWLWLGAGALLATGGVQLVLSSREPTFFGWVLPITCVLAVLAVVGLAAAGAGAGAGHGRLGRLAPVSLSVGLGALLLAPAAWAASETTNPATNATLPQAGPRGGASGRSFGSNAFAANAGLARFLRSQHRSETWDLATTNAMTASGLAAQQGLSVLPLGGFGGSDPAATPSSVASMVSAGKVRYFAAGLQGRFDGLGGFGGGRRGRAAPPGGPSLVPFGSPPPLGAPSGGGPPGGPGGPAGLGGRGTAATIMSVVTQTCTPVTSATTGGRLPSDQDGVLYDCAGRGPALAAAAASS